MKPALAAPSRTRRRLAIWAGGCGVVMFVVALVVIELSGVFGGSAERVHNIMVKVTIPHALGVFHREYGRYPTTEEGLEALTWVRENAENSPHPNPFMRALPLDPWAQPYRYRSPGLHNPHSYDVWCTGPDRTDGTADDAGNWD